MLWLTCGFLTAADLKPDEQVVLYPTIGWRTNGGWEAEGYGCVFELEKRAVLAPLLQRGLGIGDG